MYSISSLSVPVSLASEGLAGSGSSLSVWLLSVVSPSAWSASGGVALAAASASASGSSDIFSIKYCLFTGWTDAVFSAGASGWPDSPASFPPVLPASGCSSFPPAGFS